MTIRALAGVLMLNALLLVSGASLLWLARGWRTWLEFARLGGLAYLVGVAASGALWTLLLVAGVPFSGWTVILTPLAFLGASLIVGSRLRRRRPEFGSVSVTRSTVLAATGIAAAGVFLEALFRASRLEGLYNWDAWAFWVPKAKAIYYFGELDEYFFTALPGAAYPPLVPALDAAAFHLMGGVDVVTLHTQFWFLGVGFVWALAGVLCERVPAWILWPFVLVLLVAPRIGPRLTVPEADLLLEYFFVLSAILVCFWLLDGERWRLVVATILLCGLVLTKREGILLAAVLATATLPSRREGVAQSLATCRNRCRRGRSGWRALAAVVHRARSHRRGSERRASTRPRTPTGRGLRYGSRSTFCSAVRTGM